MRSPSYTPGARRHPYDKRLTALVAELPTRSERFPQLWARHDVGLHRTGSKRLPHTVVGDLALAYEAFDLPADPGRGSTSLPPNRFAGRESLGLTASWASRPYAVATAGKN